MIEPDQLNIIDHPGWEIPSEGTPITSIAYSTDGDKFCVSQIPGELSVYSIYDGKELAVFQSEAPMGAMCGCYFHPSDDNILIATTLDGKMFTYMINEREISNAARHLGSGVVSMCMDPFGEYFALTFSDGSIRVHNLQTLEREKALLKATTRTSASTAQTLYASVFNPLNNNIILAASGSNVIQIWDLRSGTSERSLVGPLIRGPGLDMYDNMILTASYRDSYQLELWDFGSAKKITDIPVDIPNAKPSNLTSCRFSRNGLILAVGGSVNNSCQIFHLDTQKRLAITPSHQTPVTCVAVSPYGSSMLAGFEGGEIAPIKIRMKPTAI